MLFESGIDLYLWASGNRAIGGLALKGRVAVDVVPVNIHT
jgi:hypothetical protein